MTDSTTTRARRTTYRSTTQKFTEGMRKLFELRPVRGKPIRSAVPRIGSEEATMSQENVEVVRGIYEAFGGGDVPTVLERMDEGVEWNEAENSPYADGNPYVGPQAVLEGVFGRLGADWDGFTVTPEELLDAGDRVVALGTYSATHKATGKGLRAQFVHVFGLRGGRLVSFQQHTDTKQFADVVA